MTAKKWLDRGVYLTSMGLSALINRKKDPKKLLFRRILCIKEDEIGDLILSLPVYEMLRLQYPEAHITLLCRPFGKALLRHARHIDRVISNYSELEPPYELIVDLRGTPASTRFALTHPPAYRLDRGTVRYRNRSTGSHPPESETNWQLISPLVQPVHRILHPRLYISEAETDKARAFLQEHHLQAVALFHTGARRQLKKWPLERVAKVMEWMHRQLGLGLVLVGDAQDAEDAATLQALTTVPIHNAAGVLNLLEFAALCSMARFFLGNDSGPLHIAAAMGTSALGLFGPGDPIFHPLQNNAGWIHHVLECNPCDQVHCKYPKNPCIGRISMEEVREKISLMLAGDTR